MPSRVRIRCGIGHYDVLLGARHLDRLGAEIRRLRLGTHPVILTNPVILKNHAQAVERVLKKERFPVRVMTVADTERSKSFLALEQVLSRLAEWDGPGRRLFLVLVGGGVVGDLGGLAAGLYRRGIPYVQVPTTLLAQVDSSIGGKTGIDLPQGKNLIGLINPPNLVFQEIRFLETLPHRQFLSGLAEVAKCGIVRDRPLFAFLEKADVSALRGSAADLGWIIARAVRVKASVVEADEGERKGIRTILNFGHTLGHAVEAACGYGSAYTHGEAVAVGMRAATELARKLHLLSDREADRIGRLLQHLGLPKSLRGVSRARMWSAMEHDKKWSWGKNRWVLPTGIGRVVVRQGIPAATVRSVVNRLWEKQGAG